MRKVLRRGRVSHGQDSEKREVEPLERDLERRR
jgi:hypothetical protein